MNKVPQKRFAILIPARLDGVRLPRKVLLQFNGIPMIEHVRRRAALNQESIEVFVVSGDQEIINVVKSMGGKAIQTFEEHENGTSRCEEAARSPRHIDAIVKYLQSNPETAFINAVARLSNTKEFEDFSIVKCALSSKGNIFFMFRRPPISELSITQIPHFYKVLGLFAVSKSLLHELPKLQASPIEKFESIEQMRLIENSIEVRSLTQDCSYPSVNIKEDIDKVLYVLRDVEEQKQLLAFISKNAH